MHNKQAKAAIVQRLIDEGVREQLEQMVADVSMNTLPSYSADIATYPDKQMPFVDKHLNYLLNHPKIDSAQYLANLRMRVRSR